MTSEQSVQIPLSKTSFVWLLVGALAFVVLGIWFWFVGDAEALPGMGIGPLAWRVTGIILSAFFSLVALYALFRLVDNRSGLVVGPEGLTDHSRAFSVGRLEWGEIKGFEITPLKSQQIVIVKLADPDRYIDSDQGNWFQRWRAKINHALYDSPVQLSTQTLQIEFDDLVELLEERYRQHRTSDDDDWEISDVPPRADAALD